MKRTIVLVLLIAAPLRAAETLRGDPCAYEACAEPTTPTPFPSATTQPPHSPSSSGGPGALPPMDDVQLSPSRVTVTRGHYPSGELLKEQQLFDGVPDGPTKEYYKNGQVMNEWNYSLGQLHGESRSFYRNGDLKTEWNYKKGKLHGDVRHYHARKILKSVDDYRDGELLRSRSYNERGLPIEDAR